MQAQLSIGKDTLGGKVAYIDATGQHGLIAAAADQSAGIKWMNGTSVVTGATGTAIGTGRTNTTTIISSDESGTASNYAAYLCYTYRGEGYADWYLPSKDELNKLYINKVAIGNFTSNYYWSSSEYDTQNAWAQVFNGGTQLREAKNEYLLKVRAVRAF
jgi:hypothetical protein